ncbi:hypothetical protein [Methylobacterium sp. 1973]|uniref:hypothetical protein n=1 Tax=Methylobacterium sp. 1973 TaxID=3156421 RepID=UPI00339B1F5D
MSETPVPEYLQQSMVERVARAICRETCDGYVVHICDREGNGPCKPRACRFWTNKTDAAKSAIAAMRNPPEHVADALSNVPGGFGRGAWEVGLDAALTSPSPAEEG